MEVTPNETISVPNQEQTPRMLQVLCIMSLCMGVVMLVLWALNLINSSPSEEERIQQEQLINMMRAFNPEAADAASNAIKNQKVVAISMMLLQCVSLISLAFLYKRKKIGLYIYASAELSPFLVLILVNGVGGLKLMFSLLGPSLQAYAWIFLLITILADVLFIYLYSRNLKTPKL